MQTSQRLQRSVVERLHAERYPIDAGGAIAAKPRGFDAGGIGFQRDFHIGRHAPVFADRIQDGADGLRLHQRRCAAAEKNRRYLAARGARGGGFDLASEGARKSLFFDRGMADMAVEIAVRTFRQAKRPVHINAEGLFSLSRLRGRARVGTLLQRAQSAPSRRALTRKGAAERADPRVKPEGLPLPRKRER